MASLAMLIEVYLIENKTQPDLKVELLKEVQMWIEKVAVMDVSFSLSNVVFSCFHDPETETTSS